MGQNGEQKMQTPGPAGLVGANGQAVRSEQKRAEATDVITIAVNRDTQDVIDFTVTPGIKNNPLDGAKVLFSMAMSLLENVSPKTKIRDRMKIPVVPLKEMLERLKLMKGDT